MHSLTHTHILTHTHRLIVVPPRSSTQLKTHKKYAYKKVAVEKNEKNEQKAIEKIKKEREKRALADPPERRDTAHLLADSPPFPFLSLSIGI